MVLSFILFLLAFVVIGAMSYFSAKSSSDDYLIAGQSVKPWLVSLSAVATNCSGYMFIGMIGFTYANGLSSIWLMIGWILGDLFSSFFIHKKLRVATEEEKALSFSSVISNWHGVDYKYLRVLGGVITIAFLGTYAAAQLSAGSKALYVLFGWDYSVGAIVGSAIVLLYCLCGGIRASIWTDAAQSFVMIIAMAILLFASITKVGGLSSYVEALDNISPSYLNIFPQNLPFGSFAGPLFFVIGWFLAGYGVIGQPHIMVRFMSMDNPDNMRRVRIYYYGWYIAFYVLTICVGLSSRILIPESNVFDPELALPLLSQKLLPDVLVGLVLAGLFAATMSTADSQILSCSAAFSCDFYFIKNISYLKTKLITVFVTSIALIISLFGDDSVFSLVLIAWSALAACFAPLLTVLCLGYKPKEFVAILSVMTGLLTVIIWRYVGYSDYFYEVGPGIVIGFLPFILFKTKK